MERQTVEMEIDLLEMLHYLKKRLIIIIAVCLVCTVAGFLGTKLFITPVYTTNTRMYVLNRSDENNVLTSDFQIATYVLNDYKALITGQNVTKEVIRRLNLNMSPEALSGMIQVSSLENTRVLQINITAADPQLAADIANTVREVASVQIKQIMEVDAVQMVYAAEVPKAPSGPNATKNAALSGILGFVIAAGVFIVIFLVDDTIRTEEDVARHLGLSTLGVIPLSAEIDTLGGNHTDRKSRKKKIAARFAPKK